MVSEPDEIAIDVVDRIVDLKGSLARQIAVTFLIDEAFFHGCTNYWLLPCWSKALRGFGRCTNTTLSEDDRLVARLAPTWVDPGWRQKPQPLGASDHSNPRGMPSAERTVCA